MIRKAFYRNAILLLVVVCFLTLNHHANAADVSCQIINPIPPTDCSLSANLKRRGAPVDCKEA